MNPYLQNILHNITTRLAALEEAQAKHYQDEGMCQACEWGQCTAKTGCVAISNPSPKQEQREPVALEKVYETIIHWDEGGGKRSRRELARRIEALYTTPQPKQEQGEPVALTWNKKMDAVQAMLGITSGELDCLGESLLETYANDVERVYKALCTTPQQRTWVGLMRGVRVEGDTVVISVKGGNEAARELCGELINEITK